MTFRSRSKPIPPPPESPDVAVAVADTHPAPEPAGLPPLPTLPEAMSVQAGRIPGLVVGRVVHTLVNHEYRAGIVSRVRDAASGDCDVYVFEPVAPPGTRRLLYSAVLSEGYWTWPAREG